MAYTRQADMGAILLKAQKYKEAEKVFREDLATLRQNGWSLIGLHKSLVEQGKTSEAKEIKELFQNAWQHADLQISTSIL